MKEQQHLIVAIQDNISQEVHMQTLKEIILQAQEKKSTKYATAYSNSTGSNGNDFTVGTVSIRGDAIQEAYVSNHEGWFNDGSYFVDSSYPFFGRGGDYNISSTAGAFCSSSSSGSALSYYSFHVVLV